MELDTDSTSTNTNKSGNSNNTMSSSSTNGQAYATPATTRLKSSYDINVIRLIGQHLNSMGLKQTAELLLHETGVPSLDHPLADRIQRHVLAGEFDLASSLVEELADLVLATSEQSNQNEEGNSPRQASQSKTTHQDHDATNTLANTNNNNSANNGCSSKDVSLSSHELARQKIISGMKLAIAKQKYLELLEDKHTMEALKCLQSEITPLAEGNNVEHLPALATMILYRSAEDLKQRANWPGKGQQSRHQVIERLRSYIPPILLLPTRRLEALLHQASQLQRDRCTFHIENDDAIYTNELMSSSSTSNNSSSLLTHENIQTRSQASNGNMASCSSTNANLNKQTNGHCAAAAATASSSATTPSTSSSSMSLDAMINSNTHHVDLVRDHVCSGDKFPSQKLANYDSHKSEVWFCKFSHDGLRLATGGVGGKVKIWQLDPVKQKLVLKCSLDCQCFSITCLSWSPDDVYLLACGFEERSDLWLFNVNKEEMHNMITHTDCESYTTCSWHMSGKRFAAASLQGNFHLYDLDGNRLGSREGVRVQCLSFLHKDSKCILAADIQNRIRAYSVDDMCRQTLNDRDVIEESFPIISFTISADDKYIAVNLQSQGVHLWDYQTMTLMRVYSGVSQRNMAIFSSFSSLPGSNFLASGSEDGKVYIYHLNKPDKPLVVLKGHSRCANCVTWNPKYPEFLVSVGDDRLVTLWGPQDTSSLRLPQQISLKL